MMAVDVLQLAHRKNSNKEFSDRNHSQQSVDNKVSKIILKLLIVPN